MKKLLVGLMVCLFFVSGTVGFAAPLVKVVNKKKVVSRPAARRRPVVKVKKVVKAAPKVIIKPKTVVVPAKGVGVKKAAPKGPRSYNEVELGLGYMAAIPAISGAIRFNNPMGMFSSALKVGVAYAVGEDSASTSRKHALIFVDGIYNMAPLFGPGIKPYVGIGLNLDAYTTGRKTGAVAGQTYFGLQGRMSKDNSAYLEVGYGYIRTGFSPQYSGLHTIVGVKTVI